MGYASFTLVINKQGDEGDVEFWRINPIGENAPSLEVEGLMHGHPKVANTPWSISLILVVWRPYGAFFPLMRLLNA